MDPSPKLRGFEEAMEDFLKSKNCGTGGYLSSDTINLTLWFKPSSGRCHPQSTF